MVHLRLTVCTSLSRLSGIISETDLLNRYLEAKGKVELNQNLVNNKK